MLESITDLLTAIAALWLLCIAMPFFGEIRRQTPIDDDITQDWADLRQAIRITHQTLKNKWRNR